MTLHRFKKKKPPVATTLLVLVKWPGFTQPRVVMEFYGEYNDVLKEAIDFSLKMTNTYPPPLVVYVRPLKGKPLWKWEYRAFV